MEIKTVRHKGRYHDNAAFLANTLSIIPQNLYVMLLALQQNRRK